MADVVRRLARSRILYALGMVVLGAGVTVYAIVTPGANSLASYMSGLCLGFGFAWWLSLWSDEA